MDNYPNYSIDEKFMFNLEHICITILLHNKCMLGSKLWRQSGKFIELIIDYE